MSLTKNLFSRKFFLVNLVLVGIMIGFLGAFAILSGGARPDAPAIAHAETQPSSLAPEQAISQAEGLQTAFNNVATTVLPAIVELDVVGSAPGMGEGDLPWRFFFGNPDTAPDERQTQPEYSQESLGSGIIVRKADKKVYVLTNNHVVEGAKTITVKLYDEREFQGTVVGTDTRRDMAIVSFEAALDDIAVARLGNSDAIKVGDWAIAIGSPFGLFSSVTAGIVSAIGRDGGPDGNINDFIQTDAAINRGNSGGALVNIRGEVIGINTWIASTTGGSVGLGFSIPINNAIKVIDELVTRGAVRYGWLGVLLTSPSKETLGEMSAADRKGAFVGHLFTDGPAAKAGLRPGDIVLSVDGKEISTLDQLVRIVGDLPVGKSVAFSLIRDGKPMQLKVTIEERKESAASDYSKLWPGLEVSALSAEQAQQLKLPKGVAGVAVVNIVARSPASAAGLKVGDVVVQVNDGAVKTVGDFYRALNDSRASKIQFTVYRNGEKLTSLALVRK